MACVWEVVRWGLVYGGSMCIGSGLVRCCIAWRGVVRRRTCKMRDATRRALQCSGGSGGGTHTGWVVLVLWSEVVSVSEPPTAWVKSGCGCDAARRHGDVAR
ncbi:hypothetical protein PLESTB_001453800 [Pleodorina starrii]|uniref:Uncharacterized protein n=1 Tax=Pleodorina starrii TaxID=330485 RepID=A0A9W6BVG0_9CHLO|nr:hypothetical protein PLESTM_000771700 [Pleodorina starrii]GLC59149.1 hypothetical protein PLESTB_001453800 [Pleodorina starrii]GLC65000.1 hypothetical protein PLESTF_000234800 [Pleodorina starrii]